MKYRSRTDIITLVLESARVGETRTKLMYKAFLSHSQVKEYLKFLQESGLLTHDKETSRYSITEKGLRFLNLCHKVNEMLPQAKRDQYLSNM